MANRTYVASDEHWDVIFATLEMDTENSHIERDIREELKVAINNVKELQSITDDIEKVVNAFYSDEYEHYQTNEDEMEHPEHHIFHSLERLRLFLRKK